LQQLPSVLFQSLPVQLHFLPDNVRVEDVVRRTRLAARAFRSSAAHGWGRTKLRSWLIVEYAMATEWTREDDVSPWSHRDAPLDDDRAHDLVDGVRGRITRLLVDESDGWHAPGFAAAMIDRGLITAVTDASGREAYAPAARAELSFLERVASIFIADFLAHPADYENLSSCECCGELDVDGVVQHISACVKLSTVRPPAESGVCLRDLVNGKKAPTTPAKAAFVQPLRRVV
jgi:hypothetical protein